MRVPWCVLLWGGNVDDVVMMVRVLWLERYAKQVTQVNVATKNEGHEGGREVTNISRIVLT